MLTREEIFAKARNLGIVTLPSGGEVKIRGLSRDEALELQGRDGIAARDNYLISTGMIDPVFTEDDVAAWALEEGAAGDMITVSQAIGKLSGMSEGAGKSGPPGS